jgi:hypothetical protein
MRPAPLALLLLLTALASTDLYAEDSNDAKAQELAKEAQMAAEEDAAASQGEGDSTALTGVVRMQPPDGAPEDVVGWFKELNGTVRLLKRADPSLDPVLKKAEGRTITLIGRLRVQGKYFIASRIQTVAAPEPYAGRRRGL